MGLLTNDSVVPEACDPAETIASAIAERGWCITDDFPAPILVAQLAREVREAWEAGELRQAGIGRGESFKVKPEVRSDQVLWLSSQGQTGATARYMAALDQLRQALNRTLLLGPFELEGHLSLYPPGARYRRHLDQFVGMGSRTPACVLYLNGGWTKEDGGTLRLYTEGNREDVYLDAEPPGAS